MPPRPLPALPNGSDVFIDANVLVYGVEQRSVECYELLRRCSVEEVTGICSYSVLVEATYQFMKLEAHRKNLIPPGGGRGGPFLKGRPDVVRALTDYWINASRLFSLNLLFLEADEPILRQAQTERENAGLLPADSVIASFMHTYGISMLATHDADFDRVVGIQLFNPSDVV